MNNRGITTWGLLAIIAIAVVVTVALAAQNTSTGRMDLAQIPRAHSQSLSGAGPIMNKSGTTAKIPKMVELFATWCPPCQKMGPILDALEKEYKGKIQFVRIDVDKNPNVAKQYNVTAIPVQIMFDESGKQVFKHVGFLSKDEIVTQFKKMGVTPATK